MSHAVDRKIADAQQEEQASARAALLAQIAKAVEGQGSASSLRNLAEAYALVVAPERSSATTEVSK